jgi:exopolysaccharide production protein ExoZ
MSHQEKLPSPRRRLSGIEAGRGIAATMVVFYHAARHLKSDYGSMPWHGFAQFGHAGVDFFFVLSGFIIFFVHKRDLGRPSTLISYFERRYTRVYPLFWLSLMIGVVFAILSPKQIIPEFQTLLQRATLLPFGGDVGVAWTLQHEIIFYLFFAIAIIHRGTGIAVFLGWLCFILLSPMVGYFPVDSPFLSRVVSMFNLEFFFGIFAAYTVSSGSIKNNSLIFCAGLILFCGFAYAEDIGVVDGYTDLSKIAYGLCSMLIVIGIAGGNLDGHLNAPAWLTRLGKASYSIYLLHLPCIGIIYKLLTVSQLKDFIPLGGLYLMLVWGAISTSIIISKYIEYPLMNIFEKANGASRKNSRRFIDLALRIVRDKYRHISGKTQDKGNVLNSAQELSTIPAVSSVPHTEAVTDPA